MDKQLQKKQKILITDDSEINRAILADMLEEEYEIIEAEDGVQAVNILNQYGTSISLILLDVMMPKLDGFGVLTAMNQYNWIDEIPVIMISAESASSYVNQAYGLGATDYISRPFNETIVRRRVINTLMLYRKQRKLIQMVTDQIYEKEKANTLMINILSHIVEFRNGESRLHVLHIHSITEILLKQLIKKTDHYHLTRADISLISTASALHDIGKITIPNAILNKPGKLTFDEFEVIKTHSMAGASMLQSLPFYIDEPIVKISYEICRWHHERYDGNGYPDKLKGEDIPISAQIVALADVYDALTSERVYKSAISHEKAIEMIINGECGIFNPLLLECLIESASFLEKELLENPLHLNQQIELQNISAELFNYKELSASERTLSLLDRERTKYQFFAMMSREIQFEYIDETHIVNISDWGARQLGLDEMNIDPYQNKQLHGVIDTDILKKLDNALRHSTADSPDVQLDCQILINGCLRWHHFICRASWSSESTPKYLGAFGKVIDIDEDHTEFLKLQYLALHDSLTKLLTHEHAKQLIETKMNHNPQNNFALVLFDIDDFKNINDSHGHMFGDYVLQYTAKRLKSAIRESDIAARIGGDEFLVFYEYSDNPIIIAQRIFGEICNEDKDFQISISMGISTTKTANKDYEILFHQSDQALYAAKSDGKGIFRCYDDSLKDKLSAISSIESELLEVQ